MGLNQSGEAEPPDDLSDLSAFVVAFSCKPNSGSEWGVGWNYVEMLSRMFGSVTLYVRDAEAQREAIEKGLSERSIGNVSPIFVGDMGVYRLFKSPVMHSRFLPLYYLIWLTRAFYHAAKKKQWRYHNYVFHVTWVSDWIFSPIFLLPFKTCIVGPLGSQPPNFNKKNRDFYFSNARFFLKSLLRVLLPNFLVSIRASAAIGINARSLQRWPWKKIANKCVILPVHSEIEFSGSRCAEKKVFFVGKNLPFKNLDLFLAVAEKLAISEPDIMFCIIGHMNASGLKFNRNLPSNVESLGLLDQGDIAALLGGSRSILLQPSSEAGGTVGVEALCLGVPVVCAAGHGVSAFYDDDYPYSIDFEQYEIFVSDASSLIISIFADYDSHMTWALSQQDRLSRDESERQLREILLLAR